MRSKKEYKEIIEKISDFNYADLKSWIISRLNGDDEHFKIRKGEENQKFVLIAETYGHLYGDNDFTICKFNPIMNLLMANLRNIKLNRKRIEEKKKYIFELINLFERVIDFPQKSHLYIIAWEGNFKGIKAYDDIEETELHRILLNALATHNTIGDYNFWIEQIKNNPENKAYVRTAFCAMIKRGYRIDVIMDIEPFRIFIDNFKEDKRELESIIQAIFNDYGKEEILSYLRNIDEKLTGDKSTAVKFFLENFGS